MRQVFLLSPARCDGRRAQTLLNPAASFALAEELRNADGAALGDVFAFLSGLYFRGKLTYARHFARSPVGASVAPVSIITTDRGLVAPELRVRPDDLAAFSAVDIGRADDRYRAPLRRSALALAEHVDDDVRVVLLGSIATGKYADVLLEVFGSRLLFPLDFVGRGDMSRGGLMLRCVREGRELEYVSIDGAVRRGKRPPKLVPIR